MDFLGLLLEKMDGDLIESTVKEYYEGRYRYLMECSGCGTEKINDKETF